MAVATRQRHETATVEIDRESTTKAEKDLLTKMARAVTRDHWKFGEWAGQWTQMYARGRTDAELAKAVNGIDGDADVSRQYVSDCRRVWNEFGATEKRVEGLTFSHHLIALDNDKPNMMKWLKTAVEKSWATTELRRQIVSSLQDEDTPADDRLPDSGLRDVETEEEAGDAGTSAAASRTRDTRNVTPESSLPVDQVSGLFDGFLTQFEESLSDLTDDGPADKKRLTDLKALAERAIASLQEHLKAIETLLT